MQIGDAFDQTGLLIREGSAFYLRGDSGGRFLLILRRVPVNEVQKQVRVIGAYVGGDAIDVEGVQLIGTAAAPER